MARKRTDNNDAAVERPGRAEIFIVANPSGGLMKGESHAEKAAQALPALGEALAGPITEFWQNLTSHAPVRPNEIEVKLGLNFEGGTSWAIVAKVGATVDVTLKWTSVAAADK